MAKNRAGAKEADVIGHYKSPSVDGNAPVNLGVDGWNLIFNNIDMSELVWN